MSIDGGYERPTIEPDNLMTGGFQTGRFDAAPRVSSGRTSAVVGLVLAVVWIFGVGSLVAICCAGLALASGDIGARYRAIAFVALALGVVGLVSAVVVYASI